MTIHRKYKIVKITNLLVSTVNKLYRANFCVLHVYAKVLVLKYENL